LYVCVCVCVGERELYNLQTSCLENYKHTRYFQLPLLHTRFGTPYHPVRTGPLTGRTVIMC